MTAKKKLKEEGLALSILVPAYNEEKRLEGTIEKLLDFMGKRGTTFEVILSDDGSTDRTAALIGKLAESYKEVHGVYLSRNRGKGAAVKKAYQAARGRNVLFMDADGATDFEAIPRFLEEIVNWDMIVGSRHHPDSIIPIDQPWHRQLMGRGFSMLVHSVAGVDIPSDSQCGFKMFTRPAADLLFTRQCIERFAFDVELFYLARRYGLKFIDLPITWNDQDWSRVNLLSDSFNMFLDVLKIKMNELRGLYR